MKHNPHKNSSTDLTGYTVVDSSLSRFKEPISDSNDDECGALQSSDIDDALLTAYLLNIQKDSIGNFQKESKKKNVRSLRSTRSKMESRSENFIKKIKKNFQDSLYSNSLKLKIMFTINKIKIQKSSEEMDYSTYEPIDLDVQAEARSKPLKQVTNHKSIDIRNETTDLPGAFAEDLSNHSTNIEHLIDNSQRSQKSQTNNESISNLFSDDSNENCTTNNSQLSISYSESTDNKQFFEFNLRPSTQISQNLSIVDKEPSVEESRSNDLFANNNNDGSLLPTSEITTLSATTFPSKKYINDPRNKNENEGSTIINPLQNNSPQEILETNLSEPISIRDQPSKEDKDDVQIAMERVTSQAVASRDETTIIIGLANDPNKQEFASYTGRRKLRPRTLKQMKPYLVDRYEHEAQLVGDFKRARLIEQAALEQNTDLLEKLQQEDRIVRERRMLAALQKEKAKESKKIVKKKKYNRSVTHSVNHDEPNDSEDSELLAIFNKYNMNSNGAGFSNINLEHEDQPLTDSCVSTDLENSIEVDSASDENNNFLQDVGIVDSQIVALKKKLSKVHVLPRSYIRQVIQDEKKNKSRKIPVSRYSNDPSKTGRKGLAVRKIQKIINVRSAKELDFVDDDARNTDNDFAEVFPNPYLDDSTLDFNNALLHPVEEEPNELTSMSTDSESVVSSPNFSTINRAPHELQNIDTSPEVNTFLSPNSSDDVTIQGYTPSKPKKISKLPNCSYRNENSFPLDECTELRSPFIDRMLSHNQKNKTKKAISLRKSSSFLLMNIGKKTYPKENFTVLQKNIKKSKSISTIKRQDRINEISACPNSMNTKSKIVNSKGNLKRVLESLEELPSNEKHGKYKKKRYFDYKKDIEHFDYNRIPTATTLQLEQVGTNCLNDYKKLRFRSVNTNPIFLEFPKGDSETLSMANYVYIFNNTSEVLKIRPLDFESVKFPGSSLLRWINVDYLNDFIAISPTDTFSDYVEDQSILKFQNIEEQILLVFNNSLEYLSSENMYPVDTLVRELKIITQEFVHLESSCIPTITSKVEIFMQNSFNIVNDQSRNYFAFVILFFPIFQLAIIIKTLKANDGNSDVLRNAVKAFKKHLVNYFQKLLNFWDPKAIANCLIDYANEGMSTVMFDVLLILFKLASAIFGDKAGWTAIIGKVVATNFKYGKLESYFNFLELMVNFNDKIRILERNGEIVLHILNSNRSFENWSIIDFFVDKIGNFLISANDKDQALQEYNLYQKHKRIFKLVDSLITNYNWVENDLIFKSLIKLIKRRNFVSFSSEYLNFRSFDKILLKSPIKISSSDNICTTFIKMVLRSYLKQSSRVEYKRIVPIFEPNSNVFSNNAKPDAFLQTFVNKMNILTLNSYLVASNDYSLIISRLLKSVILQNDLACYEKALDSMISYCKYTQVKEKVSIFDEFFTALVLNYESFINQISINQPSSKLEDTNRCYSLLITAIIEKVSDFSIKKQNLSDSIRTFLISISFPKVLKLPFFKYIQLSASLSKLLAIILKDINKVIKHWGTSVQNIIETEIDKNKIAELINFNLWMPVISLLEVSSSVDAFIHNNSIITDLVFTLSNISNLLVQLQMDNWIGLDYKWNLYKLSKYRLIWLSKVFYLGGEFCMKTDPDPYIGIFVQIIAKADPGKFSHSYFNNLMKADILDNEWLSFKRKLKVNNISLFGFGLIQRTLILSHFVNNVLALSRLNTEKRKIAVNYLDKILNVIASEFEQFKQQQFIVTNDAKQISLLDYETFVKKSLFSLSNPYGRKILYKSKNLSLVLKLFGDPKTLGDGTLKNNIEDILINVYDNQTIVIGAKQDMKMILLIQNKLAIALINNKQDKFIIDLCNSIINVEKDYFSNDIFLSRSKLFHIGGLIQIHLSIIDNLGQFSWLVLLYLFRALHKLMILSSPLGIQDFELLFKLIGFITKLCKKPVEVVNKDLDFLKYNVKKFYHSYMRYVFAEIYNVIYDMYMLLLPEDRVMLEKVLTKRTSFLKKRDWKIFPERFCNSDFYDDESEFQDENLHSTPWSQESNMSLVPQSTIDELHIHIKNSLKAIFENHKFGDLKSKNVKSSGNNINDVDLYFINAESTETINNSYLKLMKTLYDTNEDFVNTTHTILNFSY